jgi:hypothetical protein
VLQVRFSTKSFGVEAATVAAEALRAVAASLQHADMSDIIAGRPVSNSQPGTHQAPASNVPIQLLAGNATLRGIRCVVQPYLIYHIDNRCALEHRQQQKQLQSCLHAVGRTCTHARHALCCRRTRRWRRCGWWRLRWPRRSCAT